MVMTHVEMNVGKKQNKYVATKYNEVQVVENLYFMIKLRSGR